MTSSFHRARAPNSPWTGRAHFRRRHDGQTLVKSVDATMRRIRHQLHWGRHHRCPVTDLVGRRRRWRQRATSLFRIPAHLDHRCRGRNGFENGDPRRQHDPMGINTGGAAAPIALLRRRWRRFSPSRRGCVRACRGRHQRQRQRSSAGTVPAARMPAHTGDATSTAGHRPDHRQQRSDRCQDANSLGTIKGPQHRWNWRPGGPDRDAGRRRCWTPHQL